MEEEQIDPNEERWYLELKKAIPYSGFAIGVERLTQWICRLERIEEASAFPRLVNKLYP